MRSRRESRVYTRGGGSVCVRALLPLLPRAAVGRGPRESAPGACAVERRQIGRSAPNVGARASPMIDEMKLFFCSFSLGFSFLCFLVRM